MRHLQAVIGAAALLISFGDLASAQDAPRACRVGQTDRHERPAPDALLPNIGRAFGVDLKVLRGASYVRCAGGRLMACEVGANLNCGAANVSRHSTGGDAFCRESPGSDIVPLAATGHDTLYDWRCVGTRAVAGRALAKVDRWASWRRTDARCVDDLSGAWPPGACR